MKRLFGLAFVILTLFALSSCAKKDETDDLQPITMESLGAISSQAPAPEIKAQEVKIPLSETVAQAKEALPLPPQGPYKPTNIEIQTALMNAGFYSGPIDGKIGPKSKKAIEDFQGANGLKVDGKIGPKTWEVLSRHLTAAVSR